MSGPSFLTPILLLASVGLVTGVEPARTGLVCMAPSEPAGAAVPLTQVSEIEFYLDGGNPLAAYTVLLVLHDTTTNEEGHLVNTYGVWGAKTAGVSIVFTAETPLVFMLEEIGYRLVTLGSNVEETTSMADAIPGISCWDVQLESRRR